MHLIQHLVGITKKMVLQHKKQSTLLLAVKQPGQILAATGVSGQTPCRLYCTCHETWRISYMNIVISVLCTFDIVLL